MFSMSAENRDDRETEPTWVIDAAKPGDSKGITAVQRAGWLATYPDPSVGLSREDIESLVFDTPEKLASYEESIENQDDHKRVWVARESERIIGYCIAEKRDDGHEVRAIYILPECHGQGVGKALMDEACAWLGNKRDVSVWVFSHNAGAIKFYEKCGFTKTGKTASLNIRGKDIPDLEMVKSAEKKL